MTTQGSTDYISPFASFFQNVEKKRTSLGSPDNGEAVAVSNANILKCGISEDLLRFKTCSYGRMYTSPHVQPGEHQVTLKVKLEHLPLNEEETLIFKRLVGSRRVHEERDEVRLISNQFASRIENKRHVVSMLDRLVLASQMLAKGKDGEQVVQELRNEFKKGEKEEA